MTGYTKTKTFTNGETIDAEDFTTEFNNVSVAFDESTGHTHNGDVDSGAYVPLISSADTFTKITTTEATDQLNFYTNVSGAAALQLSFKDGVIEPSLDSDVDIGTTAKRFKDLYVDSATVTGTVAADSLAVQTSSGNAVASVTSTTGRAVFQVASTFDGEVADQEASIEIGAENLAHLDLKTPNSDDYDLRISHSEVSDLSIINSLVDDLFLRSGAKVALQHGGANTKLETTETGVDVTGGVTTDYIDLTGGETTTTTGTIACKMIVLNDSSNDLSDGSTIFTEANSVDSNDSSLIIQQADNEADYIKLRLGSGGTGTLVDALTASTDGINVTGTVEADAIKFTTDVTDNAQIFTELTGTTTALVIQCKDDADDSIVLRSHDAGVGQVDVLVATKTGIDVTGTVDCDGLRMDDGEYAGFGNSDDLQIFHNGTNSYIQDVGTGILSIQSNGDSITMVDSVNARTMAQFNTGGTTSLSWAGSTGTGTKLETTETGIDVTGTIECDTSLQIQSTGSSGHAMPDFYLTNLETAVDEQNLGMIHFRGYNNASTPTLELYADIYAQQVDVSEGAEQGKVVIQARNGAGYVNALEATKDGITVGGQITLPSSDSDSCSIATTVTETATHLDFKLRDDDADSFRFRFDHYEDGVADYVNAVQIKPNSSIAGSAKYVLDVTGKVVAEGFNGTGSVIVTDFIDDDTFGTATDTNVPTAESVKAYVDSNVGGITSVVAGDGLTGGATSGDATVNVVGGIGITASTDSLDLDFTELTDMTANVAGTTEIILNDDNTESRKAISEIDLSAFNNDLTFANTDTTYTAGTGLTLSEGDEFSVNEEQTQITSVGTLSALNVTGDLTLNSSYPTGTENTFVGAATRTALTGVTSHNVGVGSTALGSLTTGDDNSAIGSSALASLTTGSNNVALGKLAGYSSATSSDNIAIGKSSLYTGVSASSNTAIGSNALYSLTAGNFNVAMGENSARRLTAGTSNIFIGLNAGYNADDQSYGISIGRDAGRGAAPTGETVNFTGGDNCIAIGYFSQGSTTTATNNTSLGFYSAFAITTGSLNTIIGTNAGKNITTGTSNSSLGHNALFTNTTGTENVALGAFAASQYTASYRVCVGKSAGQWSSANGATLIGRKAGMGSAITEATGAYTVAVGYESLQALTTGGQNIAVGGSSGTLVSEGDNNILIGYKAGEDITTADNNVIIGGFSGFGHGLDLRTNGNKVVLSTGAADARPILYGSGSAVTIPGGATDIEWTTTTGGLRFSGIAGTTYLQWSRPSTQTGSIYFARFHHNNAEIGNIITTTTGVAYNTSSDYRLKENVSPLTESINRLKALKPCTFNFITEPTKNEEGFIAHEIQEVVPQAVSGDKDAVDENGDIDAQGLDTSRLVPLLTAALQEAIEKIEQLEERISALEA